MTSPPATGASPTRARAASGAFAALVVLVLTVGCTASDERGAPAVDATVSTGPTGDDAGSGAGPDDAAGRPGGPADAPDGHGEPGGPGDEATQTAAADAATEAAILEAVDGYWDTVFAASSPPDPDHPGIDRFMTGPARTRALEVIVHREELGQATRLAEPSRWRHDSRLESMNGGTARVLDCGIDDTLLVDIRTTAVLNDAVETNLVALTLTARESGWRVSATELLASTPGPGSCAGF